MAAKFGGGVLLERAQTTAPTATDWQEIPDINGDFVPPGGTNTKLDKTTHTSIRTLGRVMSYGSGLSDLQDSTFTLLFDPDNVIHKAVLQDWRDGVIRNYRITYADGVTAQEEFRASLGGFTRTIPMNDWLKTNITLYIEGSDFGLP